LDQERGRIRQPFEPDGDDGKSGIRCRQRVIILKRGGSRGSRRMLARTYFLKGEST
jgi:hypothetical protein